MGKHFQFGDGDDETCKVTSSETLGFQLDRRGGGNFSFGSGNGGRDGRDTENTNDTKPSFRGRGRGGLGSGGRGDRNFRGRGRGRGDSVRGFGRGRGGREGGRGRFSKFNSWVDPEAEKKPKLGILSDELMAYYRQVSATVEAGFDDEDPEAKKNFLDNVFLAVKDEGVKVSQNQTVSHILEGLLPHSLPVHLRTLFCEFCNHLPTMSFDRFASHVFQTIIQYIPDMYDDTEMEKESKDSIKTQVEKLCQYCLSEIKQFVTDTYGSHVLRSLLEVLGGVQIKEEVIRSHSSQTKRKDIGSRKNLQLKKKIRFSESLSSEFQSEFDAIKSEVISVLLNGETALLTDPNFSLVLQTVLLILHQSNNTEYQQIAHMLLERAVPNTSNRKTDNADNGDSSSRLPAIVQDSVGSYLIELLISLATVSEIPEMYGKVFKGIVSEYALHPVANYVLQTLCKGLTNSPNYLTEMVYELTPYMEDILACNHIGVITKMAEASQGNNTLEKMLTEAVMSAFHCNDTEEKKKKITPLIASMTVYEVYYSSQTQEKEGVEKEEEDEKRKPNKSPSSLLKTISIHGSLLLQQMVRFEKPIHIVTSLLGLTSAELSNLASDQCGSHIVEAFFKSPTVWDAQKNEFVRKLQGFYINIACNKNGSRCLEGIWECCGIKSKTLIAEELLKSRQRLESDRFGRFLWHNFKLLHFVTRQKEWTSFQSGVNKRQKLLKDILEGGSDKLTGKRQAEEDIVSPMMKKKKTKDWAKESPKQKIKTSSKPDKDFKKQKYKKSKSGKQ